MTASTWSSLMVRGRPDRYSSDRPTSPRSTKRRRHLVTEAGVQPTRWATSWLDRPSAAPSTIRARIASPAAVVGRRHHRPSTSRCSSLTMSGASGRPRRPAGTWRWSTRPATPSATNRARQRPTLVAFNPTASAISVLEAPPAANNTSRARPAIAASLSSAATRVSWRRCVPVNSTGTRVGPRRPIAVPPMVAHHRRTRLTNRKFL